MNSFPLRNRYFLWGVCFLSAILLVYFTALPSTVQIGGDSTELVYSAYGLLVPHPPGYPLWVGLGHFWLKLFSFPSAVYGLALLNFIFSAACLITVFLFSKNPVIGVVGVVSLAFDSFFWRYTVIPEVFSMHAFLLGLILLGSSSEKVLSIGRFSTKFSNLVPLFFFLAALNHLTIVFIVPVVLWRAWKNRYEPLWYVSSIVGLLLFIGGYSTLLLYDTQNIYSWGNLSSLNDVLMHFLRKDYGTFSLSGMPMSIQMIIDVYHFYLKHLIGWMPYFVTTVTLGYFLRKKSIVIFKISSFQIVVGISFIAYLAFFFGRANIPTLAYGLDTLGRFTIMPSILLVFLIQDFFKDVILPKTANVWILFGIAIFFVFNVYKYGDAQNFSENTILEDYAINFLDIAQKEKATIAIVQGDAELYALRYAQSVLAHPSQAIVVNDFNISYSWFKDKLNRVSYLNLKNLSGYDAVKDLFLPNIADNKFLIAKNFNDASKVRISVFPLGRVISEGSGAEIAELGHFVPKFRSKIDLITSPIEEFNPYRDLFAQYSFYFLAQGLERYKKGKSDEALSSFERALAIVPYCTPALKNICDIKARENKTDLRCTPDYFVFRAYPYFANR